MFAKGFTWAHIRIVISLTKAYVMWSKLFVSSKGGTFFSAVVISY